LRIQWVPPIHRRARRFHTEKHAEKSSIFPLTPPIPLWYTWYLGNAERRLSTGYRELSPWFKPPQTPSTRPTQHQKMTNSFRLIHFRKNAPATPLVSHTFKTTIQSGMVVLSEHREPKDPAESCKPFRLIQFRKNASATPLVSHTFETKDLKPFRFIHLQKKVGGGVVRRPCSVGPSGSGMSTWRREARPDQRSRR
jgi:hypothetical protein